jgi:hypothetical protein
VKVSRERVFVSRPISLAAERAVRLLKGCGEPVDSLRLVGEILSTSSPDEATARRVLEAAFSGDPRLVYRDGKWSLSGEPGPGAPEERPPELPEPDRALLFVEGGQPAPGEPFLLTTVAALRLRDDEVIAACGGDVTEGAGGNRLRRTVRELLDGAVPIVHDPPGSLRALEKWLDEPLAMPVSLRRLAQRRKGLRARHDLEELASRAGLPWRSTEDPLEMADTLDNCLAWLRKPGESLYDLRVALTDGERPVDWKRYAFDREFLRAVPRTAGTYRFLDSEGRLIYVGKSNNLHRRLNSYFRESGRRSARVRKLLDALHRIEYEASGSDLEAMLREAESIRRKHPERNVQRHIRPGGRGDKLQSILILEPAEPPLVLRAFLVRHGRLLARVGIGPRGGGLRRIRRILDDHYFGGPERPTPTAGPDLDVEVVVRWISANRDKVVAFDPTELQSSRDVIERLEWFLIQGSPFDPDGSPVHRR